MMKSRTHRLALRALAVAALVVAPFAQAIELVHYSFGSSLADATTTAQSVAEHLAATPVVGKNDLGDVVPHSFVSLTGGDIAVQVLKSVEGGNSFHFRITAQPGHTFQIDDAALSLKVQDSAGSNRGISMRANDEVWKSMFSSAGGDLTGIVTPAWSAWNDANWAALVARTDLTSLDIAVRLAGNSGGTKSYLADVVLGGNVLAVPEPSRALLLTGGLLAMWAVHRRRTGLATDA